LPLRPGCSQLPASVPQSSRKTQDVSLLRHLPSPQSVNYMATKKRARSKHPPIIPQANHQQPLPRLKDGGDFSRDNLPLLREPKQIASLLSLPRPCIMPHMHLDHGNDDKNPPKSSLTSSSHLEYAGNAQFFCFAFWNLDTYPSTLVAAAALAKRPTFHMPTMQLAHVVRWRPLRRHSPSFSSSRVFFS